jgi:hypothetical protein
MELVKPWFDRRSDQEGHPGAHALVVGVSRYPHLRGGEGRPAGNDFGFTQLSSAAISAYRFGQWLVQRAEHLHAPLTTCRMLLAPSELELSAEPGLLEATSPCGLDQFLREVTDWRADARSHRENMAFLYLAGHCIERSNIEQLFLLEDFGNGIGPVLRNTIEVNSIFNGMAPSRRNDDIARTQLYFLDASRRRSTSLKEFELMNSTPVFDPEQGPVDDRTAVTFYATESQGSAYAKRGQPTLFNQALLQCLNGVAGQPVSIENKRWAVTVTSLVRALDRQMERLSQELGVGQRIVVGGIVQEAVVQYLDTNPQVDVIIELEPPEAAAFATIEIMSADLESIQRLEAPTESTLHTRLPAGVYLLQVDISPPQPQFESRRMIVSVSPPDFRWKVMVGR